jgi:hypothetical protein|tara:strand:+ start:429 stop:671 length:243 start_codon:yes stop_codon:yes gene_type:complete
MADGQDDNNQTLFKISESGLEELSIVESDDLYNSEYDNNDDARRKYDETLQYKMREGAAFKRSDTGEKKSERHVSRNKQF